MNPLWLVAVLGTGVFGLRLLGLALPNVAIPPAWERALGFVPVALLSALVVSTLAGQASADPARLLAALGAGLVARRTGRMWACILSGMAVYGVLRLL